MRNVVWETGISICRGNFTLESDPCLGKASTLLRYDVRGFNN